MNFCDSFFFQFFDKFFHVTVECFLGEHVLKGEGTALFDYAQSFSDHIPFILGGTDFVEDKVADSGIEGLIRIFQMGGISFVLSMIIAVPLGILAATKQYSRTDYVITAVALVGISLPSFFFATLLKLLFSVKLGWFDLYGLVGRDYAQLSSWGQFCDRANHLVLPIVTLVIVSIGSTMRYTRTNMLEVLNADYIRTARAKGLSEHVVIYKHAFRNTLIPLVTIIGGSLPGLFSGALITETLFSIPGIGYISYQSMVAGDIPFTMFYLSFMAVLTLVSNLLTDIMYAVVDPRVRIS
mgnify:CR=1 FL=1